MTPARGQIMLVRNDPGVMMGVSQGENGDELGYCMTRAAGMLSSLSMKKPGKLTVSQVVEQSSEDATS